MKKKLGKIIVAVLCLTILSTVGFFIFNNHFAKGKYTATKPYVANGTKARDMSEVERTVTSEGSITVGDPGSGAEPCSDEVPTCEGAKGSATNPYVILEVVPDKSMQELTYLTGSTDSGMPAELERYIRQMGSDKSNSTDVCCKNRNSNLLTNLRNEGMLSEVASAIDYFQTAFGTEADDPDFEYSLGSGSSKGQTLVDFSRLYDISLTDNQVVDLIGSAEANNFKALMQSGGSAASVASNWPELLKDRNGKDIPGAYLSDTSNWNISTREYKNGEDTYNVYRFVYYGMYSATFTEEELKAKYPQHYQVYINAFKNYDYNQTMENNDLGKSIYRNILSEMVDDKGQKPTDDEINNMMLKDRYNWNVSVNSVADGYETYTDGYLVKVAQGTGDFAMAYSYWPAGYQIDSSKSPTEYNFKYVTDKPTSGQDISTSDQWKASGSGNEGVYFPISATLDKSLSVPKGEVKTTYTLTYYGLSTNEILKRMLFTFETQEACENFHLKVLCMTPAEINEICKKDTVDKINPIERADFFYFEDLNGTDNVAGFAKLYNKIILGNDSYTYDANKIYDFYENDLDFNLVVQILDRLCCNVNMPLTLTKRIGNMLNNGADQGSGTETIMNISDAEPAKAEQGSLSNICKLYLMGTQFNLLARDGETVVKTKDTDQGEKYKRSFYEDILPKLQIIDINTTSDVAGTATKTGYYDRGRYAQADKNDSNGLYNATYLWNRYTFFPNVEEYQSKNTNDLTNSNSRGDLKLLEYGYSPNYFDSNADVMKDGSLGGHTIGSDGHDGMNVSVVGGNSVANQNQSYALSHSENAANISFLADYYIINSKTTTVTIITVKLGKNKRYYTRISDILGFVDWNDKASYDPKDRQIIVKLIFDNSKNNDDGIIDSINIVSPDDGEVGIGDTQLYAYMSGATSNTVNDYEEVSKETIENAKGSSIGEGYRINKNSQQEFFVMIPLEDWLDGYQAIDVTVRAQCHNEKTNAVRISSPITTQIVLKTRDLFDLQ